jgi:hypothetical protein
MRFHLATLIVCGCAIGGCLIAAPPVSAQTVPGHKPAPPQRTECAQAAPLCVSVPANWYRLGDVFGELGFVAAEPHTGQDSSTWPQLTVAVLPQPEQEPRTLDSMIELLLAPGGAFASSQTLERSRTTLNGAAAEILRVQLYDKDGKAGAIEDVALIEGEAGVTYSIALRCEPKDFARLETVFRQALDSWHLRQGSGTEPGAKPGTGKPAKP